MVGQPRIAISGAPPQRQAARTRLSSMAPPGRKTAPRPSPEAALRAGFRGIDTANQRRHYFEAGVGEGLGRGLS